MRFFQILRNPLIAGSTVLLIGSTAANFSNYLYHLVMGRMLGPSDYGILESLISLLYLAGIPLATLSLVIVKYVSWYKGGQRSGAIGKFYQKLNYRFLKYGVTGLVIFILFMPFLNSFLHLQSIPALSIVGLVTFLAIFTGINRSFLQGLASFSRLSLGIVLEALGKLLIAIILVFLGLKILGAIGALLFTGILSYLLSLYLVKDQIPSSDMTENLKAREISGYSIPVFLSTLSLTSLYTTDIILVRHFLSATEAGFYAALAVLGKIIFFASWPVIMAMFPLISERHANGKQYRLLFFQSFLLIFLICSLITFSYFLKPELVLGLLYGDKFLPVAPYLGLFAVFLSFYSLAALFINFYLSVNQVKAVIFPLAAAIMQIILIFIFHQSLFQVIWVSVIISSLLLIFLVLYYFRNERVQRRQMSSFSYSPGL